MIRILGRIAGLLLIWAVVISGQAQGAPLLAFLNNAGQLVVASGDGALRWIATNPGEALHPTLGFSWSPDGARLFYAVEQPAGSTSLRVGDPYRQQGTEFARVSGSLSGGDWLDAAQVLVSVAGSIGAYDVTSGSVTLLGSGALHTPFTNPLPHVPAPASAAPDGSAIFAWVGDQWQILRADGSVLPLPNARVADPRFNGLWGAGLIAYRAVADDGSTAVGVTALESGNTALLSSGRSTPMTPLFWVDGTTLYYRDAAGQIRAQEMSCLFAGCSANPLETGTPLLPANAADVQPAAAGRVIYRDDTTLWVCAPGCAASAPNVVPNTLLHGRGSAVIYTGFNQDAFNPADWEVRLWRDGQVTPLLAGAAAGLVAPAGGYVVVEIAGDGLYSLELATGSQVFLSSSGADMLQARWNG